jgi:hypothetical protein
MIETLREAESLPTIEQTRRVYPHSRSIKQTQKKKERKIKGVDMSRGWMKRRAYVDVGESWLAGSTSLEGIAGRYAQPTKRGELTYTKMQLSDIHAEIKNKKFLEKRKIKSTGRQKMGRADWIRTATQHSKLPRLFSSFFLPSLFDPYRICTVYPNTSIVVGSPPPSQTYQHHILIEFFF